MLKVSAQGELDLDSVVSLTETEYVDWLTGRLNGNDFIVPGGTEADESRHLLFEFIFRRMLEAQRRMQRTAVLGLLRRLASGNLPSWTADAEEYLLRLVEPFFRLYPSARRR